MTGAAPDMTADVHPQAQRSQRVLIVEDNDDSRELMRMVLEGYGHEVYEASNGAEAVRVAQEVQPELFFIDIGLPVFDGYEVARRIRKTRPGGRLVAITGYGEPEDFQRSRAAGFDQHLVKPVMPNTLLAEIDKAG